MGPPWGRPPAPCFPPHSRPLPLAGGQMSSVPPWLQEGLAGTGAEGKDFSPNDDAEWGLPGAGGQMPTPITTWAREGCVMFAHQGMTGLRS